MKKNGKILFIISLLFSIILLSGCGKNEEIKVTEEIKTNFSKSFIVGKEQILEDKIYGIVVADNVKNIITGVGGNLKTLNCQPGKEIKKDDIIAIITPDYDNNTIRNSGIQQQSLGSQIGSLNDTTDATSNNFDIQISTLGQQKNNNIKQLDILKRNLENAEKGKELNNNDMILQIEATETQLETIKKSREKDLEKTTTSIYNIKKQASIQIENTMKMVDETFGVTDGSKSKNDAFEIYISAKNTALRNQTEGQFFLLYNQLNGIMEKSNNELSQYLNNISDFLKIAADAINHSVSSSNFSQVQIDSMYRSTMDASNGLLTFKTNLDNLILTYDSINNTYENQINTLTTTLQSLKTNKSILTDISTENSINSLKSQIENLQTTINLTDEQIDSLKNNKRIQINQLNTQKSSLKQNYDTLSNNMRTETLKSGIDGIVKGKNATEGNKISPNTLVCQISPNTSDNFKIQLFSSSALDLGTELSFYNKEELLGKGKLEFELPFRDSLTQNYIYEIPNFDFKVKEGDKLSIKFEQKINNDNFWIPIDLITPKLDGNYIKIKKEGNINEIKIKTGIINDIYIEVLEGISIGDEIIK